MKLMLENEYSERNSARMLGRKQIRSLYPEWIKDKNLDKILIEDCGIENGLAYFITDVVEDINNYFGINNEDSFVHAVLRAASWYSNARSRR